jgi:hypothetical protein
VQQEVFANPDKPKMVLFKNKKELMGIMKPTLLLMEYWTGALHRSQIP